jgi:hypothetical protein
MCRILVGVVVVVVVVQLLLVVQLVCAHLAWLVLVLNEEVERNVSNRPFSLLLQTKPGTRLCFAY